MELATMGGGTTAVISLGDLPIRPDRTVGVTLTV